jgi:serine/threonine protein kinase
MRPTFAEIIRFFSHVEGKLFFSSRGKIWTLDKEQEMERERKRREKFDKIVQYLQSRNFVIDYDEIQLGEKIGSGSFAKVWEGTWNGYRVGVKKLKNPSITETFFLREVSNLQKAHHPSIILFMGCCVQPFACIITEFMPGLLCL